MLQIEFTFNKPYLIICESAYTRNGFKHTATLYEFPMMNSYLKNGTIWQIKDSVKINYLNRTWEKYTFESVIHKLIKKHFGNEFESVLDLIQE